MFVAFSPDFAHAHEKILHASTRSTLKLAFGTNYIIDELFGTVAVRSLRPPCGQHLRCQGEISHAGYIKHKQHVEAPAPLSTAEVVKQEIKQLEVSGSGVALSILECAHTHIDDGAHWREHEEGDCDRRPVSHLRRGHGPAIELQGRRSQLRAAGG